MLIYAITLLLFTAFFHNYAVDTTQTNPMNSDWFNDENNPYKEANDLLRKKDWNSAEVTYELVLMAEKGSPYDQAMANINKASCRMAQGTSSIGWEAFDTIIGIPEEKRIRPWRQCPDTVLVHSSYIGFGDIVHFLAGLNTLKSMGYKPTLATRDFFMPCIQSALTSYGIPQVKEGTTVSTCYETHLVSLLGHLEIMPRKLCPEQCIYTADDQALAKCSQLVVDSNPLLFVFPAEKKQARLMGGALLPHSADAHGRELDSEPFNALLKDHPHIRLVDCSPKGSSLVIDSTVQERVMPLPKEATAFDTTIAAAIVMNRTRNTFAIAADSGPANIFSRALDPKVQRNMAFIIPNGKEYDMRMERGSNDLTARNYAIGDSYTQLISDCRIYRCKEPKYQSAMIERAFNEMAEESSEHNA